MFHNNKKGFTIVELVIVIAVVAVLAAVLIPTFANLINEANISADQQTVKQMNTVLTIDGALNGKVEINEVKRILVENGFNSAFEPAYANHELAWYAEKGIIVLVDKQAKKIVYPEQYVDVDVANVEPFHVTFATNADEVSNQIAAIIGGENNNDFNSVTLTDNVNMGTLAADQGNKPLISIQKGNTVELDLNNKTLSGSLKAEQGRLIDVKNGGNVEIKNGTIDVDNTAVAVMDNSKVLIENVTFNITNGFAQAISTNGAYSADSVIIIENCKFYDKTPAGNAKTFYIPEGNVIIRNCYIEGMSVICGGNVTIENCEFVSTGFNNAGTNYRTKDQVQNNTILPINGTTGGNAKYYGDALMIQVNRKVGSYILDSVEITNCKFTYKSDCDQARVTYGLRIFNCEQVQINSDPAPIDPANIIKLSGNEYQNYEGCDLGNVAVYQTISNTDTVKFVPAE